MLQRITACGYAASARRDCQRSTTTKGASRQDDREANDDERTKGETVTVTTIEKTVSTLADARILIDRFQAMIRKTDAIELELWITESNRSLIASFARVARDKSAVHAVITQPWSNGQVEAQITKLKLVKRQMYGRAQLDLLPAG